MDWLSLFLVAMIGAITYIQTIQGFVSALIMCFLVLMCAPLAFGTYEWVAYSFLIEPLGDLALPVALMGMFIVPLIVLRLALDVLITRANLIPILIDRGCGAVVGFIAAYVMTGVLAVAIQMLPFGGSFLGHTGIDPETGEESSLWLGPDRFAVRYASKMSKGLLSGRRNWFEDHPDLVQEVSWVQAADRNVSHLAPPDSVRLVRVDTPVYIYEKTPGVRRRRQRTDPTYEPIGAPNGTFWFLVRLKLLSEACDKDDQHRFARRQIRLVGYANPEAPASNFAPVAIDDNDDPTKAVKIADGKLYQPSSGNEVDFVFEVSDQFAPVYIEYKVGARVDLTDIELSGEDVPAREKDEVASSVGPGSTASPPSGSRSGQTSTAKADSRRGRGGRVSGARGTGRSAKFSDELPVVMTKFQSSDLDQRGGALVNGHVYGDRDDQGGSGSGPRLTKFFVPSDKRMFQLNVDILHAGSTLGRALSFAVKSLKNYHLHDDAGNVYSVVGQYAIANVDGVEVVEIQYFPEAVESTSRGGIRDFRRIKNRHLRGNDYRLAYLFLVQPGAKLTEFTTGRGRRPTDLKKLNLVAPR